jgi:hypothetical protein
MMMMIMVASILEKRKDFQLTWRLCEAASN